MVTNTIQAATPKMPVDGLIPRARSCSCGAWEGVFEAKEMIFEWGIGRCLGGDL